MTGKPINLNRVRKARARAERRAQADENAVKHGRSKVEKTRDAKQASRLRDQLDALKRDP